MAVSDFPNLFTVSGPNHPFTSRPPQTEAQVDFIISVIKRAGLQATAEATLEAEQEWVELSSWILKRSLLYKTGGWVFSENVPGEKHKALFLLWRIETLS